MNVGARSLRQSIGVRRVVCTATRHAISTRPFRRSLATAVASTKLDGLIENFKKSKDSLSARNSFSALSAEVKDGSHVSAPSADDDNSVLSILQALAASCQPEDLRIIEKALKDYSLLLGITPSMTVYTSIIQTLIENGHEEQAHNFLLNIRKLSAERLTPDLEQVHLVLESCSRLNILTSLIATMKQLGITPTDQTFVLIFLARSRIARLDGRTPSAKETSGLITGCVREGLTYDPAVANILYEMYASGGKYAQASAILDIYQSILSSGTSEEGSSKTNGKPASGLGADAQSSPAEAGTPLQNGKARSALFKYSDALAKALESGDSQAAIEIYADAMEAGVKSLDNMLQLFLKDPLAEELLDRAIAISRETADSVVPIPSSGVRSAKPYGPGLSIYHGLIRALFEAPNVQKYTAVIRELIDEMKNRGLPTNTSVCASAFIILDMRRTNRFKDSIETYHQYRGLLNEYGYDAILKEYCRISFAGDLQLPLVTEYFSMVQDMRMRKVPITSIVYNNFLHAIGQTATRINNSGWDADVILRLVDSTRRVHDFLTLDASITPDATLWNQLMNTYQRLGCFGEACRLWDVMFLSKRYNQISVNIMIDACGFARNLRVARSMLTKVQQSGFKLDLRNWNTWVECLCRCQRYKEAIEVVLVKIPEQGYRPDMQSVRVLLKFAKKLPKEEGDAICSQLEEGLPHLWKRLPRELRNR